MNQTSIALDYTNYSCVIALYWFKCLIKNNNICFTETRPIRPTSARLMINRFAYIGVHEIVKCEMLKRGTFYNATDI